MELTARLGSMLPYRQAVKVLADFLPTEPTETHATVRKRTIRIGKRLDDQVMQETWRARSQTDDRCQLEMQLPGDRRKEFVISIDTEHVRIADQHSARNFELLVARCGRGRRREGAVAISSPAAPTSRQSAIVLFTLSKKPDIAALGM
ncbi:hypothetical protein [Mesorhizobium sp. M0578]|uniref:hypothetical protein n=2 Tax=Mesorhizobium TaxID=68287 RepID=UPI00333C3200